MKPKKKYSIGIYTGGIKISEWKKISNNQKEKALSKDWCLYYSFRNPLTGKLERQPNIKAGVNYYKTKEERIEILATLARNLKRLLDAGYSPFEIDESEINQEMTVKEAFAHTLKLKKKTLAETTYPKYESRISNFLTYLTNKGFLNRHITSITKSVVQTYLNHILLRSSAANRNNTKADISSLFSKMKSEGIIEKNFVLEIENEHSMPERNKTYSTEKVIEILNDLDKHHPILALFIKFVSYNILRETEVCRLKISDIDVKEKKLHVRSKTQSVKTKIIPEIIIKLLPDLSKYKPTDYLFTPTGPGEWDRDDNGRRDYFTLKFRRLKPKYGLNKDYTINSFRHTHIALLLRKFIDEGMTEFEAKSRLMSITGHSTMKALEKYLRNFDVILPEDYSKYFNN